METLPRRMACWSMPYLRPFFSTVQSPRSNLFGEYVFAARESRTRSIPLATTLSMRASADFGALTTGAAGTQIRGSEYEGRIPFVGPPRPMSGPVPSSDGATGAAGAGLTGGSDEGTSVGATIGGAGLAPGVSGRALPPLFPGDGVGLACGNARKLIRSGSTGCSFGPKIDVNGYGISSTRNNAAPTRTWRAIETTTGPDRRRLSRSVARLGYGRRAASLPRFTSSVDCWFSGPPESFQTANTYRPGL